MAENLIEGNGLGVTKYYLNDVYTPVFDVSQSFPPGYSLLVSLFLKIFNNNEYLATTTLDLIVAVAFILVIRWVCQMFELEPGAINLITIAVGCFQYAFFLKSTPTDALSLTLLFAGIGQAVYLIKSGAINFIQTISTGFLFFLPGLFRYLNIPIGLLLPLLILATGYLKRDQQLIKTSLLIFLATSIFTIALFLFLYFYSGNTPPSYHTQTGFYPGNLTHWYPFIPASFINLDFAAQQVEQVAHISYTNAFRLFEVVNTVLFFILCVFIVIRYRKNKALLPKTKFALFIFYGVATSLLTMLILAVLALRWAAKPGPYSWTFVMEERYFGFIYILIQITIIGGLASLAFRKMTVPIKIITYIGLVILCVEVLHGIYYNAKIVFLNETMKAKQTSQTDYLYLKELCADLNKQFPEHRIIVASADRVYCHLAIKSGYVGIFDIENINKMPIKVRQKSLLVLPVSVWDYWMMKDYIKARAPKLVATITGTQFYLLELYPDKE